MEKETLHIAAAGMGVNTIAYLIKCDKKGIIFDAILFADPGKENPKTYEYIPILNKWLIDHNQPEVTIVRQVNKYGDFVGLYQDCINNKALPSIVYGFKTCSLKFKKSPQDKYLNNWEPTKFAWDNGIPVFKYKGFDADEGHRTKKEYPDVKYTDVHPLVDLNMGRFECIQTIIDAGLPLPPKSSCTFCPSMKPWEIIELYENNIKEFHDAITMERNAAENITTVKGLGRDFSWWDLIKAYRYLQMIKTRKSMGIIIPEKIKKLMLKVNRSRPIDYEKLAKERNVKDAVCDLFSQNINIPCECMD
ncbi:phosphoadenosine phosphosulfate reductase [Pedobacter punctiformis]|uniref:Phosphoadenosine phosphosulfate reductase n=1 Tax=Pedobacter punctiformis TaxID=3004097 RepID=A0ABT4LAR7_9SPHI|nr:phosphoadenosine phosphosulfate reductase [Pedobacter sp. HCMS5-2]MCZ4244961.1 phosphoadenosine phosphosulfate reductase [Pedobacter sp. HCMS5-2]